MRDTTANTTFTVVLTAGFLAFAAGIAVAHATPATGYELSIYGSTPLLFWAGIGVGFLAATATLLGTDSRRLVDGAGLLAGGCMLAVVAVPLLRSYAYYGAGDSLTHLGWAREIQAGVIGPDGIVYPAGHLLGVLLSDLTGMELTSTLLFVPTVLFPLAYLIGMPLCIAAITDSRWAAPVGVLAALLLIPINKISVHVVLHPSSQAILFAPFVMYVLFRYLREDAIAFPVASPMGASLALATLGMLLVHPQETMTLLSILVALVVVQFVARRREPQGHIASHRPLGTHTVVLGVAFLTWTTRHDRATGRFEGVIESLLTVGATTGEEATERTASLAALGGSVEELFLKLFAASLVISLLAGGLVLLNLAGKLDPKQPWRNAVVTYLTFGLIPPAGIFVIIFLANQGDHYFRFHGFIMAFVTILAAVGLVALLDRAAGSGGFRTTSVSRTQVFGAVAVVFVVLLAAQLVVVHQSPYMYQPNQQVTNAELDGHEVVFEHHDGETPLLGLRKGPRRFIDAHHGGYTARAGLDFPGYRAGVTGEEFSGDLPSVYDDDRYLVLMDKDEQREITLYEELRYTQDGFDRIERDPRVNRVQDNGALRLYRIGAG